MNILSTVHFNDGYYEVTIHSLHYKTCIIREWHIFLIAHLYSTIAVKRGSISRTFMILDFLCSRTKCTIDLTITGWPCKLQKIYFLSKSTRDSSYTSTLLSVSASLCVGPLSSDMHTQDCFAFGKSRGPRWQPPQPLFLPISSYLKSNPPA